MCRARVVALQSDFSVFGVEGVEMHSVVSDCTTVVGPGVWPAFNVQPTDIVIAKVPPGAVVVAEGGKNSVIGHYVCFKIGL